MVAGGTPVPAAYEACGYKGGKDCRSQLRRCADVDQRINWLVNHRIECETKLRRRQEKPLADLRMRVIRELERIAFADPRDVVQWSRQPVMDADGNVKGFEDVIVPTPSHKLSADSAAAVRGVTTKSGSLKIDMVDKVQALDKLGRMLGLFQDAAPAANVTVNQLNLNNGPESALEAARRLAFALAMAQHAGNAASQPRVIENEKAETPSAKQVD
jgi:hypothetical protein